MLTLGNASDGRDVAATIEYPRSKESTNSKLKVQSSRQIFLAELQCRLAYHLASTAGPILEFGVKHMSDPYHLLRFIEAQGPVYDTALGELERGRKQSHWMWFIFPQLAGLGHSPTAIRYAISGLDEAHAYLAHPLLGERLVQCTRTIVAVRNRTAREIFGSPDDLKLHSSITLFRETANDPEPFRTAIERYFGGEADARTLELLAKQRAPQ